MGVGERQRRKTPSFSSSLLDAIYHSIDEKQEAHRRRNNAPQVEEEIESLRRAIMVEKWMENYTNLNSSNHMIPSLSASSTDSSIFSSSETDSSLLPKPRKEILKKAKDPISPRARIANFLNSIFSPRNLKKNQVLEEWNSVRRKSRSMKDTSTRSCLIKTPSSSANKSKRSVRFCPAVSVIVDQETPSMPTVGSQYIKKNIDSFRLYEGKNQRKHGFRNFYENESDVDDKSCASSDLFELDSIARIGIGGAAYEEELPVYGTTNLKQLIM
ncbi:hypothetical protein ACS0TY_033904 [Phlomoides rotata]